MGVRARGFTLIELMVVVAIIGILAAIAVPNFLLMTCRAKQTEAKNILKQIVVAEEAYRGEYDEYIDGFEADLIIIGVVVVGDKRRYTYSVIPPATNVTFEGAANGLTGLEMENDAWSITQQNDPQNVTNACQTAF